VGVRRIRHPGLHDAKGNELGHRLIEVEGAETYVVDAGEGPPIVLIHGYGDTADGWRRVVPNLMKDHRVVALDMPPFGRSRMPNRGKLIDFYSDFFPAFLDAMELDTATLIGHSLGGAVALRLAIDEPERVERLGLVAPAGLGTAPPWWWHALTARPLYDGALSIPLPLTGPLVRRGLRTFLEWRLFDNPRMLDDEISHLVDLHGGGRQLKNLLAAGHACIDCYTGKLLQRSINLDIPLWMVWGRRDGLVPPLHARAFERMHPAAEVHVFDDCGHYPQIELPGRFNSLLSEWLYESSLSRRRASESSLRTRSA
jgi:pimeloyl-ACP methyl ester carboxylesterase